MTQAVLVAGCVLGCLQPAAGQRGAMVRPQNLAEITQEAATIVRGQVVSAWVEPHPEFQNLTTVVVELRVKQVWKGATSGTFRFRQFLWDIRDRYDQAGYRKGQELVLFLTRPSEYGLSSPVGLEQGRFRVVRDREGKEVALNGQANAGLLAGMEREFRLRGVRASARASKLLREHRQGAMEVEALRELVRGVGAGEP